MTPKKTSCPPPTSSPAMGVTTQSGENEAADASVKGRPRDDWRQEPNQEAFAKKWNYPIELVRLAKKENLPGFNAHGRIDPLLLIPAINAMRFDTRGMPEGCNTWREVGEKYRGLKSQIEFDEKKKSVMPTADAKRQAGEAMSATFSELERFKMEAPPDYAGRSAIEIFQRIDKWVEAVRKDLKTLFNA